MQNTKFTVGDFVRWKSQSAGYVKEKEGIVVAVVPPRVHPQTCLPSGMREPGAGFGGPRDHESYIIQVERRSAAYWPLVWKLRLQSNTAPAPSVPVSELEELVEAWCAYDSMFKFVDAAGARSAMTCASQLSELIAKHKGAKNDKD